MASPQPAVAEAPRPPHPKPLLRGWFHLVAAVVAVPAAIALIVRAHGGPSRFGAIVYGLTLFGLYAVSAAYHRGRWGPAARRRMRVADHATIYVFIAGTYTPLVLTSLHGWRAVATGAAVWAATALGVVSTVAERDRREGVTWKTVLYVVIGWIGAVSVPQLVHSMGPAAFVLLVTGGVLYTLGAVLFSIRRPDPAPTVFGYHEVWHCFVVAACACQYLALWLVV